MKKLMMVLSIITIVSGFSSESSLRAQSEDPAVPTYLKMENKLYQKQYNLEQFRLTDTNGDGYLSVDELAARPAWMGGYFYGADDERIIHADKNADGLISFEEAQAQKRWELAHARELNKKYGKETLTWYNNKEWLMEHPDVAKKLISNSNWLDDHPKVVRELYQNRTWLASHPVVAKEIYANRKWLAQHPKIAKKLYENGEFLAKYPEFAKDAEEFFQKHPELKESEGMHQ